MMETEKTTGELSLLTIMPQIHSLVLSCANLHGTGFTKSQFLVFAALAHRDRLRMTQVATYLSSSKEQATRAVAQLVEEGYVVREHDTDNRTMVYIRLADRGRELMDRWRMDFRQRLVTRLDAKLTEDERAELAGSLQSLPGILDKVV